MSTPAIRFTRNFLAATAAMTLIACGGGSAGQANTALNEFQLATEQLLEDLDFDTLTPVNPTPVTPTGNTPTDNGIGALVQNIPPAGFPEVQPFSAELADNGTGAVYPSAVNSALVSGAVIGTGEKQNSNAYKSVPFITENFSAGFELEHVIAHDSGFSNDSAYLIMHLRSSSTEVECFVEKGVVSVYDTNGTLISSGLLDFGFADGSLGVTAFGTYTDTCIAPGEIVFFRDLLSENITLDQIAGVKVDGLISSSASTSATIAVQPVSYEVTGNSVEVLISNRSTETINLDTSMMFVLTDDGVPVFAHLKLHDDVILPGGEFTFSHSNRFRGTATTVRVVLGYNPIN